MGVVTHVDSGAGIITMTDGKGGNRLNPELLAGLNAALDELGADDSVRFLLLRSTGPSFSLGMDLEAFIAGDAGESGEGFRKGVEGYAGLLDKIHRCPKTVVGLLEGPVKAGGVGLAAACDIVVCADTVDYELSELYLGLIPANVMPYVLATRLSLKRAAYLVQSAACINAETARNWGLVDEVHPADNLEKALKKLGRRLMRISPQATARQKSFALRLEAAAPDDRGALAVDELVHLASSPGVLDAVKSFSDGDLPSWFESFRPAGPLCGSQGELT